MDLVMPSHYSIEMEEGSGRALLYLKTNKSYYYNLNYDLELVGVFESLNDLVDKVEDARYQNISPKT